MSKTIKIAITSSILFCSGAASAQQKGMSWTKKGMDDISGVVTVGCGYTAGAGNQCNPYEGDMPCTAMLPVLCFYPGNFPQPSHVVTDSPYYSWSGGIVGTTAPVAGNSFSTIHQVDQFCAETFGKGWRTAEFHEGWGWNFLAFGNVGNNYQDSNRRMWVHINDQADGNCWCL